MTREEAIKVFEEIKLNYDSDPDWGVYDGEFNRRNITEILDAYTALRGPLPDPITGLMPCGCEGVIEQTDFHDGFFPHSKIECLECGIEMMRAGNTILEAHAKVKRDWNKAHGYTDPREPHKYHIKGDTPKSV